MKTTVLFVELVVIGSGTLIWLVLLTTTLCGIHLQDVLHKISLASLAPFLGVSYVLGIVFDRLAWSWFRKTEEKCRKTILDQYSTSEIDDVEDDGIRVTSRALSPLGEDWERHISISSEALRSNILYNRHRLRISRSWGPNFLLIAVASALACYENQTTIACVVAPICLLLAGLTYYTYRELCKDVYADMNKSVAFLKDQLENSRNGTIAPPAE